MRIEQLADGSGHRRVVLLIDLPNAIKAAQCTWSIFSGPNHVEVISHAHRNVPAEEPKLLSSQPATRIALHSRLGFRQRR